MKDEFAFTNVYRASAAYESLKMEAEAREKVFEEKEVIELAKSIELNGKVETRGRDVEYVNIWEDGIEERLEAIHLGIGLLKVLILDGDENILPNWRIRENRLY